MREKPIHKTKRPRKCSDRKKTILAMQKIRENENFESIISSTSSTRAGIPCIEYESYDSNLSTSQTGWRSPVAQHLVQSASPFGHACCGELFHTRSGWGAAAPHDRFGSQKPRMSSNQPPVGSWWLASILSSQNRATRELL